MIEEAAQHATRAGDEATLALVLALGVPTAPTYPETARRAEAAAAYARRVGDVHHLGIVCSVTGYKAIAQGHYREALHWLDEGMQAVRVLGNARSVFYFAGNQGLARLFLDETDEAARAFGDALAVCADAAAQDIVDESATGPRRSRHAPRRPEPRGPARGRRDGSSHVHSNSRGRSRLEPADRRHPRPRTRRLRTGEVGPPRPRRGVAFGRRGDRARARRRRPRPAISAVNHAGIRSSPAQAGPGTRTPPFLVSARVRAQPKHETPAADEVRARREGAAGFL